MMHTTTDPATFSVSIFAHHRDAALAKLAKLARKADRYGQSITWTERPAKPIEQGDRLVITATVKAHAEFRGEKETRVLRAKFAPVAA